MIDRETKLDILRHGKMSTMDSFTEEQLKEIRDFCAENEPNILSKPRNFNVNYKRAYDKANLLLGEKYAEKRKDV